MPSDRKLWKHVPPAPTEEVDLMFGPGGSNDPDNDLEFLGEKIPEKVLRKKTEEEQAKLN